MAKISLSRALFIMVLIQFILHLEASVIDVKDMTVVN